jgi:hypothetical protein
MMDLAVGDEECDVAFRGTTAHMIAVFEQPPADFEIADTRDV